MKIIKIIGIAIVAIIGVVLIVGMLSPREVELERSITIDANAESVFEEIKGIKALNSWSPWQKIDPQGTKYTFEGPETGVGSKMSWESEHPDVGTGSQEIIESVENKKVRTELYFGGFDTPNYADITIEPDGYKSKVTWTFEGDMGSNPVWKLMGLMMDSMLGPSYEEGLQNLKAQVESK
ncbi:SRPBCC family protein [Reichenbachiella sp. MALMAid0571]|uniref:SRPBCC family protein n=1 Tax=Reichenbachiella sp. MALMAid0571 TaxID=3143939 RepID=UPI0032DF30BA